MLGNYDTSITGTCSPFITVSWDQGGLGIVWVRSTTKVQDLEFRALGSTFTVLGLGFRV